MNMLMRKRLFRLSLVLAAVLVLLSGCRKKSFDEDMLIGTWEASDGYNYTFMEDHTGISTDNYDRGLPFDWSLDADELQLRFHGTGDYGKVGYYTFVIESLTDRLMEAYDKGDYEEEIITFRKK